MIAYDYVVEVRNLSTGDIREITVCAHDKHDAIYKALKRKPISDDFDKGYLFTFRSSMVRA